MLFHYSQSVEGVFEFAHRVCVCIVCTRVRYVHIQSGMTLSRTPRRDHSGRQGVKSQENTRPVPWAAAQREPIVGHAPPPSKTGRKGSMDLRMIVTSMAE
jgi:hypothetical protein